VLDIQLVRASIIDLMAGPTLKIQDQSPGPVDHGSQAAAMRIWHIDDERALIRLVPEAIREKMVMLSEDFRVMSETDIRKKLKPTPTDNQLRLSFWLEYNAVQESFLPKMVIANVLRGICSEDYFYGSYLQNPIRVAWLITPPVHYTVKMTEALEFGIERLREVLEYPLTDAKGKVNVALARLMSTIVQQLETRVHGAVAQKLQIEQKTLTLKAGAQDALGAIESRTMLDIDKRLHYLEKKEKMIESGIHPSVSDTIVAKIMHKAEEVVDEAPPDIDVTGVTLQNEEKPVGEPHA
jgi:hypothetical protein